MICSVTFNTRAGEMTACATGEGICLLEFSYRANLEKELDYLQKVYKSDITPGTNMHLQNLMQQLEEYFEGSRHDFSLPLLTPGTAFQNKVWKELMKIPYGTVITYLEESKRLGNNLAIRAVAAANGQNRIAVIIPCHRVIASDGKLTGYSGGIERKRWLLKHEAAHSGNEHNLFSGTLFN
jgi:AraC family transcriptional regulator, regulatory protein of adaptative response / methylated-DNA-[protein]-cysteine methyltransferase